MRKILRLVGRVVAIPLMDGSFGFGRVLRGTEMAFYDLKSWEALPVAQVISEPVLFRLLVTSEAIHDGVWAVIGRAPLSEELLKPQPYLIWESWQPSPFILLETVKGGMRAATPEECQGLERAEFWYPHRAAFRLYDTLTGDGEKWAPTLQHAER